MGFVKIVHDSVGSFQKGLVVAEEWFSELPRLLEIGAVEPVDPRDVPPDAIYPPVSGTPAASGMQAGTTPPAPAQPPHPALQAVVEPEPTPVASPEQPAEKAVGGTPERTTSESETETKEPT